MSDSPIWRGKQYKRLGHEISVNIAHRSDQSCLAFEKVQLVIFNFFGPFRCHYRYCCRCCCRCRCLCRCRDGRCAARPQHSAQHHRYSNKAGFSTNSLANPAYPATVVEDQPKKCATICGWCRKTKKVLKPLKTFHGNVNLRRSLMHNGQKKKKKKKKKLEFKFHRFSLNGFRE